MAYTEIIGHGGIQAFFLIAVVLSVLYTDSVVLSVGLAFLWTVTLVYQIWAWR